MVTIPTHMSQEDMDAQLESFELDMPNAQQICNGVPYYQTDRLPFWHVWVRENTNGDGEVVSALPHVQKYLDEMERLEAQHYADMLEDERLIAETGYHVCPSCGERKLKVTTRRTLSYGGGWDTFEQCTNCDYRFVCV